MKKLIAFVSISVSIFAGCDSISSPENTQCKVKSNLIKAWTADNQTYWLFENSPQGHQLRQAAPYKQCCESSSIICGEEE